MNNKTDKIKSIISEAKALDRFLLSRGIDPRFVTTDQKVSHAKSGEFQKWLRDRQFREEEELEDDLIEQKTPQEKFKAGLKKAGYDPDKGAKRLTDVIAKQKKEREEHEKKYGHLYAKEATDYSLVKGQSSNPYNKDVKLSNGYVTKNGKQPKGEYERSVDKYLKKKYNKEEVEQVDELNKSTVKSYLNKKINKPGVPSQKDVTGMANATVRLMGKKPTSEEVESIDEISKELKTSYRQKAIGDIRALRPHAEKGEYKDLAKNVMKKRQAGVNRSMKEDEIKENHIAVAMGKELDDEGSMTLNQMDQMERAVDMVRKYIGKDMTKQLPSWVQSKITLATDYIDSVGNYLNTTNEEVKEPTGQLKDACWTGYTAVGMKMKNGKKVPNCVPTKESFEDEHGISDKKKQSSKSARIIKSIYKRNKMTEDAKTYTHEVVHKSGKVVSKHTSNSSAYRKADKLDNAYGGVAHSVRPIRTDTVREDIYDHEKDDKSVATYGKKPKMAKTDDKAGMGENKPEAAAVMSGGTTLTGQKRDVVEIDPMMRKRPGQPDPTKK
jgi:hypothetical protein